ncbi:MAG: hypothetical protein WC582_00855 [Patescibacteria group bacterium]|jgi:hypothetical protein
MTKTAEQYNRLKRWYNLFLEINQGITHNRDSDYYVDTVYSFFQNCHHLKDWVVNDEENVLTANDLNVYINRNKELKVCGALCNGSKHLVIKNENFDKNTRIDHKEIKLALGGGTPHIKIKFEISTSDETYDAFDLATKCLSLWEDFLKINKII